MVVEVPPEPAFAQDLKLNAFDHTVQAGSSAYTSPLATGDGRASCCATDA